MNWIRSFAGACAAAGLALGAGTAAQAACQLQTMAQFPIVMHGNEPLVEASINGQKVNFLLDTGASTTVITREAAERLGLHATYMEGVTFYGVGGSDAAQITTVHDLKIGASTAHDIRMVVTGHGFGSAGFVGLLGADFLMQADIELDLAGGFVRLFKAKGCQGDEVVYWNKPYAVAQLEPGEPQTVVGLFVDLNGRKVRASLDSGSDRTIVTTVAARNAGVTPHSANVIAAGTTVGVGHEQVATYVAEFPTLSVGDETVRNVTIELGDIFAAATDTSLGSHIAHQVMGDGMLLGADFIKAHRIYVARGQGKMYFSYNGGPIFEAGPKPKPEDKAADAPQPGAAAKP
jgi:clan AA aspartic protease (TIGR02281 family)